MMMTPLTREQLEERLAALHQVSLDLVKETSLDRLLEKIAHIAMDQTGARYAAVGVLGEDGQLEKFIPIGMSPHEVSQMEHPPVGLGLIGALMNSRETILVPVISNDPRSAGLPQHHPPMTSFLGVPILQGDRQLGQIYLTNKLYAPEFTRDDQQVIETLAAYAAIGITNVRLYKQLTLRDQVLTRRNENMALVNDLAYTLASSADVDQILEKALMQVMDYLNLELGEVFLRVEESKTLRLNVHRGTQVQNMWRQNEFQFGEGIIGLTAQTGIPRLLTLPGSPTLHDLSLDMLGAHIRQVATLPLTGRRGVVGVLCVATAHAQPLDDLEMQLLAATSSYVGMAIENVRASLQQRRLAVLEERERIGMDLHDGIIQSIYAVGLTLEHARLLLAEDGPASRQRIDQAISDLNSTIRDIRAYILDLRPRQLHDESLMKGLQRLVTEFRVNTLVDVNLEGPGGEIEGLTEVPAVALFHICQESLANIAKHARARHVDVCVWSTSDRVLLEVRDDGKGFDVSQTRISLGHGLSNMQTRARNAGGDVEISSEAAAGTTVLAWVPLANGH